MDIRDALRRRLESDFEPDTRIVEEMGLCFHDARIDFAAINGSLHGFEIKSDFDTLDRLARQVEIYSRVMDFVTIVVGAKYVAAVSDRIPAWWGIEHVAEVGERPDFCLIRAPRQNPTRDPFSIAQLLWKEEAVGILESMGTARGYRGKSRRVVFHRLTEILSIDDLSDLVRSALKVRSWRSGQQQIQDAEAC